MEQIVFYSLATVTIISALATVLMRNVLHSALFLGLALAGVAGIFASLGADFLFAAQILIYVSGVAVLVLFVVMLAGRASELNMRQINNQWFGALLVCTVLFGGMWRYISAFGDVRATTIAKPTTHELGRILLSKFAVPFELITLILIVALIGAVIYTRPEGETSS